jgi:transposase
LPDAANIDRCSCFIPAPERFICDATQHKNGDRPDVFTRPGRDYLKTVEVSAADRFALDQVAAELDFLSGQLRDVERRLREFAETAPAAEREARTILQSIPGVGPVTADIVLSELAGVDRFRSAKKVVAYAGLAPGQRESDGKRKELHIEKSGSKHLRWVLVEAAWQLVRRSVYWRNVYEKLKVRLRSKKAIVAIARRLLCVMTALLKSGQPYDPTRVLDQALRRPAAV